MGFIRGFVRILGIFLLLSLAATALAATGTIQINVHPGGGTVCIDTVCKENPSAPGEVGTITFDGVESGSYHMLNVYGTEGYEPYLGQVFLDLSGTSLTREITLKKSPVQAPEFGSVRVYITPDGGRACLDRMCEISSGDGTGSWNVEFTEVTANTYHTITISHDGYESYVKEIYPVPNKVITLSVTLQKLPPGSTPLPTPTPEPTPTPAPTRADPLPLVPVVALALCGMAWALARNGRQ